MFKRPCKPNPASLGNLYIMMAETTQQKPVLVGVIGGSGLYKLDNMTHV